MSETVIDLKGNVLKVKRVDQTDPASAGNTPASAVDVTADSGTGITAGNLQDTLVALATRIKTLEDAGA